MSLYKPEYVQMVRPLKTIEAARLAARTPGSATNKEARNNPAVVRWQAAIQKACLIYENESLPDHYRLEHGLPSAWDGGTRVIEQVQLERWRERRHTRKRRPRYLDPPRTTKATAAKDPCHA